MPLFKKILAPTDFSENAAVAVRLAATVAAENAAELHVIHVVGNSPLRHAVREGLLSSEDTHETVTQKVQDAADEKLAGEITRISPGHELTAAVTLFGEPFREVVEYAEKHGIDLIVMGRRGETLADLVLGSTAERVIRHAPCPVLITRSQGA